MITIHSCPKKYNADLDKSCPPEETVARARAALNASGKRILAETRRVDTGRLGIPVFMSVCGEDARTIMPTRKQMGKGASPAQAEASALMELVERFSFFSFWEQTPLATMTWSEASATFGPKLLPMEFILQSVDEKISPNQAIRVLDLTTWNFASITEISTGQEYMAPLDWFKKLNEFNGASAGNTLEESMLQGGCELVERHVCALVDRTRQQTPTLDPTSFTDPVLIDLHQKFIAAGLTVWLKDFTLDLPVPTVAALVMDPATFPDCSEIVFTAGTATCPQKAAIRALTEVAQLGGDFCTNSNYEASGLPKFTHPDQFAWLTQGPLVSIDTLPSIQDQDISQELLAFCTKLKDLDLTFFSANLTCPELGLAANYNIVPGFLFRERTPQGLAAFYQAYALSQQGLWAETIPHLDRAIAHCPEVKEYFNLRGVAHFKQSDFVQAAANFELALNLDSGSAMDLANLGLCHKFLHNADKARELLTQALRLDPALDFARTHLEELL